jgi:hypothetical protein
VTVRRLNEMEAGVFKLRQREIALSICIVNYNTKQQLRNCIESILACQNKRRLKFEIIVADNGSSDGSAGMVKRFFPRVKLITNQTNTGYARGVNRAMETSRGRFIRSFSRVRLKKPSVFCLIMKKRVSWGVKS